MIRSNTAKVAICFTVLHTIFPLVSNEYIIYLCFNTVSILHEGPEFPDSFFEMCVCYFHISFFGVIDKKLTICVCDSVICISVDVTFA